MLSAISLGSGAFSGGIGAEVGLRAAISILLSVRYQKNGYCAAYDVRAYSRPDRSNGDVARAAGGGGGDADHCRGGLRARS